MRLRDDRRAAALQVGAILLLGFLVIGLALYQATVVPNQNEEVEFDHNQQVQDSLQEVRNGILRTAAAERTSPTTVPLGTRYPTRIVAVNPPPSSGRLATESGGTVTLVNATAVNDETADYWNGADRSYATQRLSYRPDYSIYQSAPRTTYANTVLYNDFGGQQRAVTDQRLLEGNLIYVVALEGSYSRSGTRAVTVSPSPVSTSDRTVAVNNSSGLKLEVDTDLTQSQWRSLLEDQYERNGGRIAGNASGVTVSGGTLTVDLRSGTYRLRMAKVGVGTGVSDTSEQYLTVVDGADSVTAGGTRRIELEVRDSYNNPVPGVAVNASVNRSDARIQPNRAISDGQGRVVFEYITPGSLSSVRSDGINFTYRGAADRSDFSGEEPESVRINVTVVSLNVGESTEADRIVYDGAPGGGPGDSSGRLRFDIRNQGEADAEVTAFSVSDGSTSDELQIGGGDNELEITGGGTDGNARAPGNNGFSTDGTSETLDTNAVIEPGATAQVTLEQFEDGGSDVDLSSATNVDSAAAADITVTFEFVDGSTKSFYFAL